MGTYPKHFFFFVEEGTGILKSRLSKQKVLETARSLLLKVCPPPPRPLSAVSVSPGNIMQHRISDRASWDQNSGLKQDRYQTY